MAMAFTMLMPATFNVAAAETDEPIIFTKDFISVNDAEAGMTDLIKLEAYTTGSTSHTSTDVPADIVLVLDQSGSMDDTVSDTSGSQSKLTIMKNAVTEFVNKVDDYNIGVSEENQHRVAIVGFADTPGFDSNTEILTTMRYTTTTEYQVVANVATLDISKTYYIEDGEGGYKEIKYYEENELSDAGWYTVRWLTGWRNDYINVNTTTVYKAVEVNPVVTSTQGVEYSNLLDINYETAFVNCTTTETGSGGKLAKAIGMLDGNGATRIDYGMEMAANIFAAQPAGTYANRNKIVLVLTDGVPTTSSSFSATVANRAVATAKDLKAGGAHIFSTYLGTPASNSASFLQALSSNYPTAENYTDLTNQAASSYYSSHTNAADITALFGEIVFDITANSPLDETSVVTDTISEFFRLPSIINGAPDPNQIKVYTLDSTGYDSIAGKFTFKDITERKPFETAKVTISEDGKTVQITGFNFAYNCLTATAKDGASNYGRKLIVYIPIVVDESTKTFGGHLPTNDDAIIYHHGDDVKYADKQYDDLPMDYIITNEMYSVHLTEGNTYDFKYADHMFDDGGFFDKMIADEYKPNGKNNAGVTMAYELIDADGTVIATLNVDNPGDVVDVTDSENWDFGSNTQLALTIASGNSVDDALTVKCTLTNPSTSEQYEEDGILGINVVNNNVHIVGGVIDDGGTVTPNDAPLNPNSYREEVEATGLDTHTPLTFNLLDGFEFERIVERTLSDDGVPFGKETVLYDIADANNNDTSIFQVDDMHIDGRYKYVWDKVNPITKGITVEVYTRPINYILTTQADANSSITDGMTYTYDAANDLRVIAAAHTGYKLSRIVVNGTEQDFATLLADPTGITTGIKLTTATDAYGTVITGADIFLPRTQNNDVLVESDVCTYTVTYNYWALGASGYGAYYPSETYNVDFGADLNLTPPVTAQVGDEDMIDGANNHTLKGWYAVKNGDEFAEITDITNKKMGAANLEYHAFWEKNPSVEIIIENPIQKVLRGIVNDDLDVLPSVGGDTFTFIAVFHETVVGSIDITVPDGAYEAIENNDITVTLTDAQYDAWVAGDAIYLIEKPNPEDTLWIYDEVEYIFNYDATNGYTVKTLYDDGNGGTNELTYEKTENLQFFNDHIPYIVSYNLNGGTIGADTSIPSREVGFDSANLLPRSAEGTPLGNPSKLGYTFIGWKVGTTPVTDANTYTSLVNGDETIANITLVAQYTANGGGSPGGGRVNTSYTLTYESNGGTEYKDEEHRSGTTVKLDKVPKKEGFIFDGWHTDKACEKDATEIKMTSDKTVYANWIEDNGAAGNGHETPSSLNGEDHFAYVIGYPDDTVRPHNNITRAEVATIFFRLIKDEVRSANLAEENSFNDVSAEEWYNTAISTMEKLGIVNGRDNNNFVPNDYITRAEFAAICARFDDTEYTVTDEFTDVAGHWAEDEIHEAAAHGWIKGYDDNTFKPDRFITRAEAMTMINRVLNRVPENADDLLADMVKWPDNSDVNAWYYLPIQEATNSHDFDKKNNIYEKWTAIRPIADWEAYE